MARITYLPLLVLVLGVGCSDSSSSESPSPVKDSSSPPEASTDSAQPEDSSADTAESDTLAADTSIADSAVADTSVADTSVADTSVADTSIADTSIADTSSPDTSTADTSVLDTGIDASKPDVSGDGGSEAATDAGSSTEVLLISEVQSRGSAGGADEFIEIYNPGSAPVVFDATWEVWSRSASTTCAALNKRLTGGGQTIPAHGHILHAGSGYDGALKPDGTLLSGVSDSGQIVLLHGSVLVDSLCYSFNATTQSNLTCATPPAFWFACSGAVSNLPHNDGTAGTSNSDVSLERKPGGAAGNGQNTGDNTADFSSAVASNPQNLASAVTP